MATPDKYAIFATEHDISEEAAFICIPLIHYKSTQRIPLMSMMIHTMDHTDKVMSEVCEFFGETLDQYRPE